MSGQDASPGQNWYRRRAEIYCRRPETSGCRYRLLRHLTHVGAKPVAPPTCISWCQAAVSLPTTNAGLTVSFRLFRRIFPELLEDAFYQRILHFFGSIEPLRDALSFQACLTFHEEPERILTERSCNPSLIRRIRAILTLPPGQPNHHSAALNRRSPILAAIPIALPSPTNDLFPWRADRSRFSGKTIATNTSRTQRL